MTDEEVMAKLPSIAKEYNLNLNVREDFHQAINVINRLERERLEALKPKEQKKSFWQLLLNK